MSFIQLRRATSYTHIAVATEAFKLGVMPRKGIRTNWSQWRRVSNDRPWSSEPVTNTSGPSKSTSMSVTSPSAARPITLYPESLSFSRERLRLTTRATGRCSMAPAATLAAEPVKPALRRCGKTRPWAPIASADRTTAPRLWGSVIPSRASNKGGSPSSEQPSMRAFRSRVSAAAVWRAMPW